MRMWKKMTTKKIRATLSEWLSGMIDVVDKLCKLSSPNFLLGPHFFEVFKRLRSDWETLKSNWPEFGIPSVSVSSRAPYLVAYWMASAALNQSSSFFIYEWKAIKHRQVTISPEEIWNILSHLLLTFEAFSFGITLVDNEYWEFFAGVMFFSCAPFAEVFKIEHHITTKSISDFPSLWGINQHWPTKSVDWAGGSNTESWSSVGAEVEVETLAASLRVLTL